MDIQSVSGPLDVPIDLGVKARTSRLFSLFLRYLDKKLKVLDYAIKLPKCTVSVV